MNIGGKEDLTRILSGSSRNMAFDTEGEERDVDRVAALGMAQTSAHHMRQVENANRAAREAYKVTLGRHVIAFRQANDPKAHPRVLHMLTIEMAERLKYIENKAQRIWTARAVARQAIQEHVIDICPVCVGKAEIPAQVGVIGRQVWMKCTTCNGDGKRKYTVFERGRELFCKPNDVIARRKVDQAIEIMKEAEGLAVNSFIDARGIYDDY